MKRAIGSVWLLLSAASLGNGAEFAVNGRRFPLPDDYSIRQVAGPPLVQRPISADFDERGRLYVTESSGSNDPVEKQLEEKPHSIIRLEDTDGDGTFDRRTLFAQDLMFPEGILWHDGSLYVAAPPRIWKLTDEDDDGVADQRTIWFDGRTLSHCANDLHGPYLGPDGWIYWCKGAFAKQQYVRHGRQWSTRASHLFRRHPRGGEVEPVMTGGMDNPVEVVFTRSGEPVLTATFIQHPAGGKRDGLIHAIYGGLFGKRHSVLQGHRATGNLLPPLLHLGAAAPSGLTRLPSAIPASRETLLATSFNMHKVTRHRLTKQEATFDATTEDFLTCDHVDFHPTDVLADADGSLLVIDTGGWYKLCCPTSHLWKPDVLGAIYRIERADRPSPEDPRGNMLSWENVALGELVRRLADARPAVRSRAASRLVSAGNAGVPLLANTLRQHDPNVRLQSVWILCRIGTPAACRLLVSLLADRDGDVVAAALKALSLHRHTAAAGKARRLLRHPQASVRRNAAELCGRIGDADAVPLLLQALSRSAGRYEQHALIYALIEIGDPDRTVEGIDAEHPAVRAGAAVALNQMAPQRLDHHVILPWLTSPSNQLRQTARWIVVQRTDWSGPLARWLEQQLGRPHSVTPAVQSVVTHFAEIPSVGNVIRQALANATLGVPDRVALLESLARQTHRSVDPSWNDTIESLLRTDDTQVLRATIEWLEQRELTATLVRRIWPRLLAIARAPDIPDLLRLRAIARAGEERPVLPGALFDFVIARLDRERPIREQLAAADVIRQGILSPAQRRKLIRKLPQLGPLTLQQILAGFARVRSPSEQRAILEGLGDNPSLSAIPASSLRQVFVHPTAETTRQLAAMIEAHYPAPAQQRRRLEQLAAQLPPGDRRRGYAVFFSRKAACSTCHSIGYLGGNTGPDLTKVGEIRTERDLLEAIVFPSASFVRSFEPVTVLTDDGRIINGIVRDDTPSHLLLVVAADRTERVAKESIEAIQPGKTSIMPAGIDRQLSLQELADLVAFLKQAR